MLQPKTAKDKKHVCFVISEELVIYGVFVIFITKIKNSHLSLSLASSQNFYQSALPSQHQVLVISHPHDLQLMKSLKQISMNFQP